MLSKLFIQNNNTFLGSNGYKKNLIYEISLKTVETYSINAITWTFIRSHSAKISYVFQDLRLSVDYGEPKV